jgi:hypothetical protein
VEKYTQGAQKLTIKYIYQMTIEMPRGNKIQPHFPFQGLPKYYQIGTFGMQKYHLATLESGARVYMDNLLR